MVKITKRPVKTAVPFPRAINSGVDSVKVNFDDFTLEVRDVETMGAVEIIHQVANPKAALQVVHTKDLCEFDKMLGKEMGMHVTSQYITEDYFFFVLFSGIQGDFAKNETDLHVRLHRLFEKKVSTYPRVDTRYLTDDIYPKCRQILQSLKPYNDITEYLITKPLSKSKRIFDGSKVTDHHAIIPTGKTATLTDKENKVFDLIARRFIAVFMPDSITEEKEIEASCAGITLKATSSHTKQQGWKDVYPVKADESQTENHPDIKPDDEGPHTPVMRQKKTTPPKPYTEATLLRAMETAGRTIENETIREAMKDNGIGRPSSRAAIIETLIKRRYVSRKGKALAEHRKEADS